MACISKLANAIAYDCDSGATGLVSAMIINKADIASFTVSLPGIVPTLTLVAGASAYKIDTVKRSLVLSTALKVNDGAPNANTHTASITLTGAVSPEHRALTQAFTNGSFVIIAKTAGGTYSTPVLGLYYGLSATGMDGSSHENGGWITVTLETPENVVGEDSLYVTGALYDALYAAAVG